MRDPAGGDGFAQVRAEFFLPHSDRAAPKAVVGAGTAASQLRIASAFRAVAGGGGDRKAGAALALVSVVGGRKAPHAIPPRRPRSR